MEVKKIKMKNGNVIIEEWFKDKLLYWIKNIAWFLWLI